MKSTGFWFIGILLVASCVLTGRSAEATDTNFWISLSSGRWDTGANWSFSIPPSTNSQSYTDITNSFGPSQTSKIITIDSTTALGTMSISNLLLSAPIANNGTQNVQGQNTLLVSNAASTTFRILNTLTMTTGGSISITNSTVLVDGTNVIVAAYIDGNIWLNTGTFMVTNKIMELGYLAQGSLTVSNGTTDIGALEIGENPGSVGTLTVAGGANALDGYMLVGNSPGATGTVWMTGGSMLATGSVTRVGNAGPGQMIVSNGAWASQGLEVGSFAGGNGTLTLVAGSVAAKGPFIVGGGIGTVVVGPFAELAITNLPTASFTGLGFFICDGSALVTNGGSLLATNAFTLLGEHGRGSLTNSGGIIRLQELSIGLLAGSSGTFTMLGGTTTVSAGTLVGNAINATGTVWMSGGQFTGPMTVGSAGIGRVAMSNGTMNVSNLVVGLTGVGTFTMAGGTNLPQVVNIGLSSSTGQLWITGGQIGSNGVDYTVGVGNVGVMTISNGVALGSTMSVGFAAGSRGTVSVSGGTVAMTGPLMVGGNGGTGLVQVTGGQLVLTNTLNPVGVATGLVVDGSVTITNGGSIILNGVDGVVGNRGSGSLTNLGGLLSAANLIVGSFGGSHGTLTMSDGTITATGSLTLGKSAGANGTLWMTGGTLLSANAGIAHIILGSAGQGAMIVSNGTVQVDQTVAGNGVNGSGVLTIAGGNFLSQSTLVLGEDPPSTGTVWVTSGVLALTNSGLTANIFTLDGIAQLIVSNGQVVVDAATIATLSNVGQGTFTFAGGTTVINTNLVLGNACSKGQGNVVINGGSLFVTNASHTAVLDVRNGTLQINSGTLVVDKIVMTNSCAQFVRTGGTLIYGSAVLNPSDDTDGDGIPNGYEQSHGLDPLNPADASADNDGDGFSNLQEYLAGTDPNNSASAFRITSISQTGNNVLVTWMMGSGKTNALQVTAGAGDGSYQTNSFANLFIVTNTVGTLTNYLDVGGATNTPSRYYRVRLVP
jgi:T5SS/PEP-CTERM-associated repeat protein